MPKCLHMGYKKYYFNIFLNKISFENNFMLDDGNVSPASNLSGFICNCTVINASKCYI